MAARSVAFFSSSRQYHRHRSASRDSFGDHVASLSSEPLIQAVIKVGEFRVIKPHQVQDRRVQIGYMHWLFHGFESEFVRRADRLAAFHTCTRQPHGEAVPVVISSWFSDTLAG